MKEKIFWILDLLIHKISKEIKKNIWFIFREHDTFIESEVQLQEIDVVITLVEKDLQVAELCIDSLRKYSLNPIRHIYVISPLTAKIREFCRTQNAICLDEDEISPLNSVQITELLELKSRVGWIKQQLIKLNSSVIPGISDNYLIIDGDTMLTKPQFFINQEYTILKFSDEFHFNYKRSTNYILKKCSLSFVSFIAHHQLINSRYLQSMKQSINTIHNKLWYMTFIDAANKYNNFVSEYEIYAQYVLKNYKKEHFTQYWFNHNTMLRKKSKTRNFNKKTHSLSLHNY
jgi:hypothetical protein